VSGIFGTIKEIPEEEDGMRADRLLSMLMILQSRGQVTAERLAEELEVSVRTIYRDMDALSAAGVPVYADRGPGGGVALLESYRTTLTGLSNVETRALFMLSIPAPLARLGVTQDLKAALLKLTAALPSSRSQEAERTRQRIFLDPIAGYEPEEPLPHLQTIHQAVWQEQKLHLKYRLIFQTDLERLVEPYGLVAKGSVWHLVYRCEDGGWRVLPVAQVQEARLAEDRFERLPSFDLSSFWNDWCAVRENSRSFLDVTVRISPRFLPWIRSWFKDTTAHSIQAVGDADEAGWVRHILRFESFESARTVLLGWGNAAEVLEPEALRLSILDFAGEIVVLYKKT
jgi:predicted DNA-binding transcriptional regulator YafY